MSNINVLPTEMQQARESVIERLEHALEVARASNAVFVSVVLELDDRITTIQSKTHSRLRAAGALALAQHNLMEQWEEIE